MPEPVELKGRSASPGAVIGPLYRLDAEIARRLPSGEVEVERAALSAAVVRSIGQITRLADATRDEGRDILEFQAAMLSDEELMAPAQAAIENGASAEAAWLEALNGEIAGYEISSDEYFRARASDLIDLRDRVLRNLAGTDVAPPPPGAILTGEDVTPTRFLEADWSRGGGIALAAGSARSHVAMLARARGVPMVVGIGTLKIDGHAEAMVDGDKGAVVLSPGKPERTYVETRRTAVTKVDDEAERYLHKDAKTGGPLGVPIDVMVNIARPDEVDSIDVTTCDGVGLMRTEFLFTGVDRLPDEEMQYRAYSKVLDWASGRPVTIRTIDAGGDKPVRGLTVQEDNPFLGLRGIRLSLARPEVFRVQLRALARAAVRGNLKVMLPMVTVPSEIEAARGHLDEVLRQLSADKIPAARPPLGIMVEVPAVAITPRDYTMADFFSIGSNDLTQYVTAASRDNHRVADLCDIRNPAVMRLITDVAGFGRLTSMEVSLCGDAAGDPALVPMLLKAGLRTLSVAPPMLGAVKAAIARTRLQ